MNIKRGANGDPVRKIQQRLSELHLYNGIADGSFGGGTESAVKTFQKANGLNPDGCVGDQTWGRLFPATSTPDNPMRKESLAFRCLALSGSFETTTPPPACFSGLSGNFDGMGISFGAMQWNLGQGTLQPLFKDMLQQHPAVCEDIFHENLPVVHSMLAAPVAEQLELASSIQTPQRWRVNEPWKGMLQALGRTPEFQGIQVQYATKFYDKAQSMCADYGLRSERAVALMFDIVVQNGSIGDIVKAQIRADFALLTPGEGLEVARMKSIARRRAAACRTQYINDVLTRKLTIAEGCGTVHGLDYDLEEQFGIGLRAAQ